MSYRYWYVLLAFSHSYSQIWNGDDDDIDEIKEVGAEVIALNKKIAAGTF
jgi:hypothetical protein